MNVIATHRPDAASAGELLHPDHRDQVRRIAHQLMHRLPASVDVTDLIDAGLRSLSEFLNGRCRGIGAQLDASSRMQVRQAMLRTTGSALRERNSGWYPVRDKSSPVQRAEQDFGTVTPAEKPGKELSGLMPCTEG